MIFNTIPSTVNQVDISKQIVSYPASFITSANISAFCKTEGYNGYNLVFATINTGTPPTIQIFDIDRNYLKVATVTMPTDCTNITACMFYNGTLYIAGGTASSSGMYRMTFAVGSTIAAPTFDVSALITTDGTTAIANTSVGYTMNYITIGTETRILIAYKNVTPALTYISSYNVTSTSANFDRVDATPAHASYGLQVGDKGLVYVESGATKLICTISSISFLYRGILKFIISDSFEITFPATIGTSNKLDITGYVLSDLIAFNSYIYLSSINISQTNNYIIKIPFSDLITGGAIAPLSSNIIALNYFNTTTFGVLQIKNNKLITSTLLAVAPMCKWIHIIDLTTFTRFQCIEDGAYNTPPSRLGVFISQRSSNGLLFENIDHYVSNALAASGFCNVFKFYSF